MTLQWGYTVLRLHPLLPFLLIVNAATGNVSFILPMALALLMHEAGHFLACRCFGLTVSSIEITPFGGMMEIERFGSVSPMRRFLIALAGPLFSLLGLLLLPELTRVLSLSLTLTQPLTRHHLLLLVLNLLPVTPLDGGHMAETLLRRFFPRFHSERLLLMLNTAAALLLCLLSVLLACRGELNFAPAFAGLYLLYAGWREQCGLPAPYISTLIGRRQQLLSGKALPVRVLAVGPEMPVRRISALLSGKQYHEIWVLTADGMTVQGRIDEKTFCEALFNHTDATAAEMLKVL